MSVRRIALAGLFVLAPFAATAQQAPPPERREITVSGIGEVGAAPDLAIAGFTVQRSARTAREALDQANEAMTGVIAGLKQLGLEARDLQTSGFGIMPQYRYETGPNNEQKPPELVGYEVRNSLTARIRDVAKVGEILDRAVTLGVNSGGDISFQVDDPAELRRQARKAAVKDAMIDAEAIAEAAGATLGDVVRVSTADTDMPQPPVPMMRMAMDSAAAKSAVPVENGETTFRAGVSMTFAILPAAKN